MRINLIQIVLYNNFLFNFGPFPQLFTIEKFDFFTRVWLCSRTPNYQMYIPKKNPTNKGSFEVNFIWDYFKAPLSYSNPYRQPHHHQSIFSSICIFYCFWKNCTKPIREIALIRLTLNLVRAIQFRELYFFLWRWQFFISNP